MDPPALAGSKLFRWSSVLLLSLAVPTSAFAQYQASNRTARRLGLQVGPLTATVVGTTRLEIDGPPGASVIIYGDYTPQADTAFVYGTPLVQPVGVQVSDPNTFDLTALLTGAPVLVLPPTGRFSTTFPSNVVLPPTVRTVAIQAAVLGSDPLLPAAPPIVSNTVVRTQADYGPAAYNLKSEAGSGLTYFDVEQGDVDGDGDLDSIMVRCDGTIEMQWEGDPLGFSPPVPVSAVELVDLDHDNYLDIVYSAQFGLGGYIMNLGRAAPDAATPNRLGKWLGYGASVQFPVSTAFPAPRFSDDIETADLDMDGDIDVVVGVGGTPGMGGINRIIINTYDTTGVAGFMDGTRAWYRNGFVVDNTEDVELHDVDGDGDYDLVVGNFDLDPVVNYVYQNQNGVRFGPPIPFRTNFVTTDPTMDVALGDFNGDGVADIYVSNWFAPANNLPASDGLFYGAVVGGVYAPINQGFRLPDNVNYVGPTPVMAEAAVDAEVLDFDLDGQLDVMVAMGTRCLGPTPATGPSTGLRAISRTQNGEFEEATAIPVELEQFDYSDLEPGDVQQLWVGLDFLRGGIDPDGGMGYGEITR